MKPIYLTRAEAERWHRRLTERLAPDETLLVTVESLMQIPVNAPIVYPMGVCRWGWCLGHWGEIGNILYLGLEKTTSIGTIGVRSARITAHLSGVFIPYGGDYDPDSADRSEDEDGRIWSGRSWSDADVTILDAWHKESDIPTDDEFVAMLHRAVGYANPKNGDTLRWT